MNIYEEIGYELGIEPALVYAIARTESSGHFEIGDGKIPILYERHWAYRFIKKHFEWRLARDLYRLHPDIINPKWGGYGKISQQYARLAKAINILKHYDSNLGIEIPHLSTSFGAFQIMGFNYKICGYNSAKEMSDAYHRDPQKEQIKGFIEFIKRYKKGKVLRELKAKNWQKAALYYNGSGYKRNSYDRKLAIAYEAYKKA